MGSGADDLTDTWHGRFDFPCDFAPVSFTARLVQRGDRLAGEVEEPGSDEVAPGRLLTATVAGRVAGGRVDFVKAYAPPVPGYGSVHYEGAVRDGGLEIAGTWRIPGAWSGTFIMIRPRGLPSGIAARRAEPVS